MYYQAIAEYEKTDASQMRLYGDVQPYRRHEIYMWLKHALQDGVIGRVTPGDDTWNEYVYSASELVEILKEYVSKSLQHDRTVVLPVKINKFSMTNFLTSNHKFLTKEAGFFLKIDWQYRGKSRAPTRVFRFVTPLPEANSSEEESKT